MGTDLARGIYRTKISSSGARLGEELACESGDWEYETKHPRI